jgi:uncharacterized protein with gpF-like domain
LLNRIWKRSAKQYEQTGSFVIEDSEFEQIYRNMYKRISDAEFNLSFDSMPKEKTVIDALATLFSSDSVPETITYVRNLMQQYFNVYVMQRLREVSENTRKQIQLEIQRGVLEGLGGREIARNISRKAPEINRTRAIRIARTESVTAANRAQLLAHEASPFVYEKAWLKVVDGRTRESHLAMDSSNFIDLMDYFIVGGEQMLAPGDTDASAGEVINCRCVLLFKAKRGENGRLIRKNSIQ